MHRRCDGELLVLRSLVGSREVLVDIEFKPSIRSDHSNDRPGGLKHNTPCTLVEGPDRHPSKKALEDVSKRVLGWGSGVARCLDICKRPLSLLRRSRYASWMARHWRGASSVSKRMPISNSYQLGSGHHLQATREAPA